MHSPFSVSDGERNTDLLDTFRGGLGEVLVDHLDETLCAHRLSEKEASSAVQSIASRLAPSDSRGQENNRCILELSATTNLRRHITDIEAGHQHVEQNEIGFEFPRRMQSLKRCVLHADFKPARLSKFSLTIRVKEGSSSTIKIRFFSISQGPGLFMPVSPAIRRVRPCRQGARTPSVHTIHDTAAQLKPLTI